MVLELDTIIGTGSEPEGWLHLVLAVEDLGCNQDGEACGVTLVLVTINSRMDDCGG